MNRNPSLLRGNPSSLGSTPQTDVAQEVALLRQELRRIRGALLPGTGTNTGRSITNESDNMPISNTYQLVLREDDKLYCVNNDNTVKCFASGELACKIAIERKLEKVTEHTRFGYGVALEFLILGAKIQRAGWNGKDMWIAYMSGMELPAFNDSTAQKRVNDRTAALIGKDVPLITDPYIAMWTAQGTWQPGWLPSQADQFAVDWRFAPTQIEGKEFLFERRFPY